jgi:MFS family permease
MASAARSHDRRWLILAILGIAQLMVVLDATVVNIALPSAQEALGFSESARQWIVTSQLAGLTTKPTPADLLAADVHGYTTCFYWAGVIFVIAAICAFGLLRAQARPPTPGVAAEAKQPAAEPAAG